MVTCVGNPDPKFVSLGKKKCQFLSVANVIVAYIDGNACVTVGSETYPETVRCSGCLLLSESVRCLVC